MPDSRTYDNGFKAEWEMFIRHLCEGAPFKWTLVEGAKGVQLAEAGMEAGGAALGRHRAARGLKRGRDRCPRDLPVAGGKLAPYSTRPPRAFPRREDAVQPDSLCGGARCGRSAGGLRPWLDAAIDWEGTVAFRRHLWSLGLGVAEAMDTAQRGMGMDWPTSLELIRRSLDAARDFPVR